MESLQRVARQLPDNLEHDLPAYPTGLAELVRTARLGKGKDILDDRLYPAGVDQRGDLLELRRIGLDEKKPPALQAQRALEGHRDVQHRDQRSAALQHLPGAAAGVPAE